MATPTPAPVKKQQQSTFWKDFLMGGVSGAIAKTLAAPIERVKLLLQTQHTNPQLLEKPYKGIGDCFARVLREEGPLAYWKGNWANVLRYFPTTAINFSVKDYFQGIFLSGVDGNKQKGKFFLGNLLSGGFAGAIGLTCVYWLDFARTRLAADIGKGKEKAQFKGLGDCVAQIFKQEGMLGLYRGFFISVIGIFIYRAFYFGGYDSGKQWVFGDDEGQRKASFFARFFFAQIIVSTSETISFPLDTVRRRLMMQSGRKAAGIALKYSGTIDCFAKTLKEEGVKGFFKGNLSNIYRSVGSSLVLVLYDKFKKEWFVDQKH